MVLNLNIFRLKSKLNTRIINQITIHSYRKHECELCKAAIPERIRIKNEVIYLIDWDKLDVSYIALESITREKHELHQIYIVPFKEKSFIRIV